MSSNKMMPRGFFSSEPRYREPNAPNEPRYSATMIAPTVWSDGSIWMSANLRDEPR